ncbi:MAG TPA: triphosphoribosyl-dephospho-CoA synthase [Planctomycetaceae bacterium]|nr:triphosphoribosyl-dephospho-CoA synthase [Planctomycetaceae bacterium]
MTLAEQIELACLMEATARKPGNVHPGARFDDLCYDDFVRAAASLGPCLERSRRDGHSLGETILKAVEATRCITESNANLGIILLLAPLTLVPDGTPLHDGLGNVLRSTTVRDAELVYEAIRLARPGGLGKVEDQDVSAKPTATLREVMALAADRDLIARQFINDFEQIELHAASLTGAWLGFEEVRSIWPVPWPERASVPLWEAAVIRSACYLLIREPDTLITRKCGGAVAAEAAQRSRAVLEQKWPALPGGTKAYEDFDAWLRADGHRRNPGTTADLIAACLFWAIREGYIQPPTIAEVLDHARQIGATKS